MRGDAVFVERRKVGEEDAECDSEQRSRQLRNHSADAEQHDERCSRESHRGPTQVAQIVDDAADLFEEARSVGVAVDAEQLGKLAGGNGEPDTDLDPDQRRSGDVVDQRAQPQQPGGEQDHADEQREHRQVANRIRSLGGDAGGDERRAGEQSNRGRRAHRQCG
jgi:uncharacterized protein (DUF3084 family)